MLFNNKKLFSSVAIIISTLSTSTLYAQEVVWPDNPTIGLIGASLVDPNAPDDSALAQAGIGAYIGGSYKGLRYQLTRNHLINNMGFVVQSRAQGGGNSFDIPEQGFKGYDSQLDGLLNATFWFDGQSRLEYIVMDISNDCLHTGGTTDGQPCTPETMTNYVNRLKGVVERAQASGITVIVDGYSHWETIDMELAGNVFSLPWVINETDYRELSRLHKEVLSAIPGVIYLDIWGTHMKTIDGLHPIHKDTKRAASVIARAISRERHSKGE